MVYKGMLTSLQLRIIIPICATKISLAEFPLYTHVLAQTPSLPGIGTTFSYVGT